MPPVMPMSHTLTRQLDTLLQAPGGLDMKRADPLIQQLQEQLGPRGQGNVVMAQINPTPGDLAGNASKILAYIQTAEAIGADLILFPELSLMGYPIRDVIARHPFLVQENLKWLRALAKRTGETIALVGFVEPRDQGETPWAGKPFYNSVAVLQHGQIRGIVRKSLLPDYHEFEEYRTFEFSPAPGVFPPETLGASDWQPKGTGLPLTVGDIRYGISICEDLWGDPEFFLHPAYRQDPLAKWIRQQQPDVLINLSASPSRSRKEQLKHHLLSFLAKKYQVPLVYVNQCGSIDEMNFDGASRLYDETGALIARAAAFEERFVLINPPRKEGAIEPLPVGLEATLSAQKIFDAYDTSDLGRTYQALVQGIRDYFVKNGFQRAVLGLSGGLDSSVVVTLLTDALGADQVLGVSMPSQITPTENREDIELLAKHLGILLVETPIEAIVEALNQAVDKTRTGIESRWGQALSGSNAADNAQAITRATILRQLGNDYRALPIATSDKSEFYLGYATVNGDMSGALAPIGDLPKTKVRALAHWLNEHRVVKNAIPERIITRPSGADLRRDVKTGQLITAEQDLMPYEFADEVIWRIEALQQGLSEMLEEQFQYERMHPVAPAQKAEWLCKFFDRMQKSVFKWFIAPPILMVEGNGSIAKTDYHHPISSRVCWQGHTTEAIAQILDGQILNGRAAKQS